MTIIQAHEAIIQTATIEIKSLTVNGRQVTLALFRQLKNEKWDSPDGVAPGAAWGSVNYHPDPECKVTREHVHIVWQLGQELRRALVRPPDRLEERDLVLGDGLRYAEAAEAWLDAAVLDGWKPKDWTADSWMKKKLLVDFSGRTVVIEVGNRARRVLKAAVPSYVIVPWVRDEAEEEREARIATAQAVELAEATAALAASLSSSREELAAEVLGELEEQEAVHARRRANWQAARALPQLFIAV